MSPAIVILRAIARSMRRDAASYFTLKVNNLFLFVLLLIGGNLAVGLPPSSAYPFLLLLGFLLLFPLSSDPLAKVPPIRLAAWPLANTPRALLRFSSIALSPVFWIAVILFLHTAVSLALAFLALAVAMQVALALAAMGLGARGRGVALPLGFLGKLGPLVAVAVRQTFSILDTYVALLIAIGGCIYRFAYASSDPAAYPIFSMLIALALSSYAQNLFCLESPSAWTRYGLLPVKNWEIYLAKDTAFLTVLFLLTWPLNAIAGMSFGLASLGIGRLIDPSTMQSRWRFIGGKFVFGVLQIIVGSAFAIGAAEHSAIFALVSLGGYIVSTAIRTHSKTIKLTMLLG